MGKAYYGVPNPDTEDGEYYYDYEPILTQRDEEEPEESGISPQNLIIFLMALPVLPLWTALAILIHPLRIAAMSEKDPIRTEVMKQELRGFIFLFFVGIIMYRLGFLFLNSFMWQFI